MDLSHDRLVPAAYGYTQATPHTVDHWRSRVPSAFTVACMCQSTATCSRLRDLGKRQSINNRLINAWNCMDRLLAWRELGGRAVIAG